MSGCVPSADAGSTITADVGGISNAAREKLGRLRPRTLGAAGRIDGVRPSDVALVGIQVQRMRGGA